MDVKKKPKKILYITYDGLTDPLGQSQILPYLIGLSKYGYSFTILSFEKKERFNKYNQQVQLQIKESNIKWVYLLFTKKPPLLSKLYDVVRMRGKAFSLYKQTKFDMIHCRSYVAADVGLRLKNKFGVKFFFDMRGFWADEKIDNGQWNRKNFLYKEIYNYYKKKERKFLLAADGIISLTQAAKNFLLSIEEYKYLKIEVIPCCVDLNHFDWHKLSPVEISDTKRLLNIPESAKTIIYLGSTGGWYLTSKMLSFFKTLLSHYPEYVMLILTNDDPKKIIDELNYQTIPLDKVFITSSGRESLPKFLMLGTLGIFFIGNTFSKIASSPTKHAEMMAMGIPVICNSIGDTGTIVRDTSTGIVVDDFSKQSFENSMSKIPDVETIKKDIIRKKAEEIFDLEKGINKYLLAYQRAINNN